MNGLVNYDSESEGEEVEVSSNSTQQQQQPSTSTSKRRASSPNQSQDSDNQKEDDSISVDPTDMFGLKSLSNPPTEANVDVNSKQQLPSTDNSKGKGKGKGKRAKIDQTSNGNGGSNVGNSQQVSSSSALVRSAPDVAFTVSFEYSLSGVLCL